MSFVIRKAGFDDYEATLDIHPNVFTGVDYLPTLYHYFLHTGHIIIVVEKDGLMVILQLLLHDFTCYQCKLSGFKGNDFNLYYCVKS